MFEGGAAQGGPSRPFWSWTHKLTPTSGASVQESELEGWSETLDHEFISRLLTGVGVYGPNDNGMFDFNEMTVLIREASRGKIGCLFASPDIVYGTNMPLTTVYIGKGYGQLATRNSLFQLIGRAGRTGLSNKARIIFEDIRTMKQALLPSHSGSAGSAPNVEAQTMNAFFTAKIANGPPKNQSK